MDETRPDHHHRGRSRRSQLEVRRNRAPVLGYLYLRSLGHCVPVAEMDRPEVAAVVIEDLCWQIALDDWVTRRPHGWRRQHARAAWRMDGERLLAERDRMAMMACEVGMWAS
jgi:hypothetical protein